MEFIATNTNSMMHKVYNTIAERGVRNTSRNGSVLRLPGVTTMVYTKPTQMANFCPVRKANPFFHLLEAVWVLAGRKDVAMLSQYNKGMVAYSDDGVVFNAPYGFRIRHAFDTDQLYDVLALLRREPDTRQAVIQIWDATDLNRITKDKACNMSAVASVFNGSLDLTVFNRSNDAVWGAVAGTNPVQFGFILRYLSEGTGFPVGRLNMVSNNLHVYENQQWEKLREYYTDVRYPLHNKYKTLWKGEAPAALWEDTAGMFGFDRELRIFCRNAEYGGVIREIFASPFLENVAKPMHNTWVTRKYPKTAESFLSLVVDPDWRYAAGMWLDRRYNKTPTVGDAAPGANSINSVA